MGDYRCLLTNEAGTTLLSDADPYHLNIKCMRQGSPILRYAWISNHSPVKCGMKLLIHSHCNYLSMLGLKLFYFSQRCPKHSS